MQLPGLFSHSGEITLGRQGLEALLALLDVVLGRAHAKKIPEGGCRPQDGRDITSRVAQDLRQQALLKYIHRTGGTILLVRMIVPQNM